MRVWSAAVKALRLSITRRGPGRGTPIRTALSWGAMAVLCGACLGQGPPDRAFPAEVLGLGASWEFGDCTHRLVTLRSGATLDVIDPGTHSGCAAEEPTRFLFGGIGTEYDPLWEDSEAPLFLTGLDGGERWLAVAVARGKPGLDCWRFYLGDDERAFLEGKSLHLSNGLLLPLAEDYDGPNVPSPIFPLWPDEAICLDVDGHVTTVIPSHRGA